MPAVDSRRRALLALVHIAKAELGLDDATYRAMLRRITRRTSAAKCTNRQLEQVLDHLRRLGWQAGKPRPARKYDDLGERPGMATPRELRYIEALWAELTPEQDETIRARTLRAFLRSQYRVEDITWLTEGQAHAAIEALKAIKRRRK